MEDIPIQGHSVHQAPVKQLIISFAVVFLAGSLCFLIFLLAGSLIFKFDTGWFREYAQGPLENAADSIKYMIVAQDVSFFIVPSVIILLKFNPGYRKNILSVGSHEFRPLLLVVLLSFALFPVTSLIGSINQLLQLPGWLSGLEEWIRNREETAQDVVSTVLKTRSVAGMWFNVFLLAIVPAISEELIFRGVFQKIFSRIFNSGNLGVWLTAFIFSAIHLQFYGFLPRLMLGLVFGYIFLWSENIWLPVLAHFLNNAVPAASAYAGSWNPFTTITGRVTVQQVIITGLCAIVVLLVMKELRKTKVVAESSGIREPGL
jgi:uncharacterized protein